MHVLAESNSPPLTPVNSNHETDLRYAITFTKWILLSIGIWPIRASKFLLQIPVVLGNLLLGFSIVPCALYICYQEKDVTAKLKLCGLLSFCIAAAIKYCALVLRRPGIKHCVECVKVDWQQVEDHEDREVMLKYAKVGRNLTMTCIFFMYGGGFIYHTILPFASPRIVNEHNVTLKPLVYPVYDVLYNPQKIPVYQLVYLAQCGCGYVMYTITSGACGMAAVFATHACGQIEILMSKLDSLTDGRRNTDNKICTVEKRLNDIVRHHLRVLKFSNVMEQILQEVCLVEFVGSTFMICLLEYYCLTDWEHSDAVGVSIHMMLLISLTFNIFILCYIGDLLIDKTSTVGIRCLMTDWYRLPAKTARSLVLIIAVSSNPIKITAGRMVDLSLSAFGNVLKTSVAYLSFLRTTLMS